jgi:hypothetical protein
MSNRCCHKTKLKATNKKALAINVTHSGRTAFIFNMGGRLFLKRKASANEKMFRLPRRPEL